MSLVISVHTSLPCAQACDEDIGSSRSEASSNASIVTIVCSINSRMASRRVAAMGTSTQVGGYLTRNQEQTDRDECRDACHRDGQRAAMPQAREPPSQIIGENRRAAAETLEVTLVHLRARHRDLEGLAVDHDGLKTLVPAAVFSCGQIDQESAGQADHGDEHGTDEQTLLHMRP